MLLGGLPPTASLLLATPPEQGAAAPQADVSWVRKVTARHKAVLDVPEVDSGFGVFRATIWQQQYAGALGIAPKDINSVLVLRHNGIALAMQQKFWDEYEVGKVHNVIHPTTGKPTSRNPALLSSSRPGDEAPPQFDSFALDKFIAAGGVALGCSLAMEQICVRMVAAKDKISEDAARKKALSMLVPGVIMQPSGIFATIRAQEAGCAYVRAS
jgi:hypothetical protein